MREIVQDIRDITYSRELYEAKPRPFASAFIYIVLIILVVAIAWMAIGSIDIVVKANGYVRPNQQVSTVVNRIAGEVEAIYIDNGQAVQAGDILYVINHDTLKINQGLLEERVTKAENEIALLKKYKDAINQDNNLFDPIQEEAYYERYEKFILDYLLNENDYLYAENSTQLKQSSVSAQMNELEQELALMELLEQSIQQKKNLVSGSSDSANYYANRYVKYNLDYTTIEKQYEDQALEIESGKSAEFISKSLEETKTEHEGYVLLLKSIESEKNEFTTVNSYANLYSQYVSKVTELLNVYVEVKKNYDLNLSLKGIAVTNSQIEQSKQSMDEAFNTLQNYKMTYRAEVSGQLTELELRLLELEKGSNLELTKDVILENNQLSKERALNKFKTDTLVALQERVESNQQNLITLKQNQEQLTLEASKILKLDEAGKEIAALENYKITEIINVINAIDTNEQELSQLKSQLDQINQDVENATVQAQISGKINIITDIAKGDSVFAGTQILTIVPYNDTTYKVQVLLNNMDVAKVKVGDPIKYHFQALPFREYGELNGSITKISTDAQMDEGSGQSFYFVEATLDEKIAHDYKGNMSEVKVGMLCEAQVITSDKKILRFLLEKINLLD